MGRQHRRHLGHPRQRLDGLNGRKPHGLHRAAAGPVHLHDKADGTLLDGERPHNLRRHDVGLAERILDLAQCLQHRLPRDAQDASSRLISPVTVWVTSSPSTVRVTVAG